MFSILAVETKLKRCKCTQLYDKVKNEGSFFSESTSTYDAEYMILWHTPVYAKDANPRYQILFILFFPSLIRWSTDLEIYDIMHYYVSTKSESIEWFLEIQASLQSYDSDPRPLPLFLSLLWQSVGYIQSQLGCFCVNCSIYFWLLIIP